MTTLSVIMPVYNSKDTIETCLESVLSQSLKDMEIIVVDDCSNDDTPEILDKYKDKITIIRNEKNSGTGFSRNKGVSAAKGKYIGFIDDDDFVESDYFEKLFNSAEKNNADVCVALKIANHKDEKITYHLLKSDDLKRTVFIERTAPWAKIIKREFWIQNNIKFDLTRGEDIYPAFLCAYSAKKISSVKDAVYHCTIRNNSVSHKEITENDLDEIRVYAKILNHLECLKDGYYWQKLVQKRGMISFDFLYKRADSSLQEKLINLYSEVFNIKNVMFKYKIWKIKNLYKKTKSFLRGKNLKSHTKIAAKKLVYRIKQIKNPN